VAHAVESLTGYRRYKHGEAVAIGMVAAAIVALECGRGAACLVDRVTGILKAARLPIKPPSGLATGEIVSAMGLDKKVAHGRLHAVLVDDIGSSYVTDAVSPEMWREALELQARL
jgi:3-dehydroquinate synthase